MPTIPRHAPASTAILSGKNAEQTQDQPDDRRGRHQQNLDTQKYLHRRLTVKPSLDQPGLQERAFLPGGGLDERADHGKRSCELARQLPLGHRPAATAQLIDPHVNPRLPPLERDPRDQAHATGKQHQTKRDLHAKQSRRPPGLCQISKFTIERIHSPPIASETTVIRIRIG